VLFCWFLFFIFFAFSSLFGSSGDAQMNLTISSPLESHKAHTLCFSICGVDVGFENPIFAAIELDYEEADAYHSEPTALPPKMLTFYELDLGLNHMVRKWSEPVDASANLVIAVPGATDGPGGVLVCSEDYVSWRQMDQPEVRVALPRRMGAALARGQLVTAFATYRQKKSFFFLLQTEFGDLFKLTLIYEPQSDISAAGVVTDMKIRYLDSLPPAVSLCLTRTGLLYSASEFGAQYFFQIQSLGDDDAEPIETSASSPSEMLVCFDPRPLRNLALLDEIDSLAPLIDLKVCWFISWSQLF
jgi:splicing factor 3B subunit 3